MNEQQLLQAYKDEKNVKVKERLFLIKQVFLDKQIVSHVAKSLGRVRSWAYKWLDRFTEYGIAGLQDLPRSGRPTSQPLPLGSINYYQLQDLPRSGRPTSIPKKKLISIQQQIAENQSGWSAKQVMNLIYQKSGVKYHEVHVYRLLHQWGYTPKVAAKRFVNSATPEEKLWFKKNQKRT